MLKAPRGASVQEAAVPGNVFHSHAREEHLQGEAAVPPAPLALHRGQTSQGVRTAPAGKAAR